MQRAQRHHQHDRLREHRQHVAAGRSGWRCQGSYRSPVPIGQDADADDGRERALGDGPGESHDRVRHPLASTCHSYPKLTPIDLKLRRNIV